MCLMYSYALKMFGYEGSAFTFQVEQCNLNIFGMRGSQEKPYIRSLLPDNSHSAYSWDLQPELLTTMVGRKFQLYVEASMYGILRGS